MGRPKKNYDDIAAQVIKAYEELHNIFKVAVRCGITQRSVSTILREAGINLPHHGGLPKAKPEDKDTCFYCRAYSRTDITSGWCMTHRRMTGAGRKEACYK